ncbi:MAG: NAD(P)/FAD-dependent oxidoreductase [Leptospiraceae bacterium]|nr:NAD(P)/FAD-dependent oxidoreductase [Leptospiraceae bacterium]
MKKTRVVIVGAGFGGLNAANELKKRKDLEIILIDRKNHHLFQPLLYQVATGALNPADIAVPIRSIFSHDPNIIVYLGNVVDVDFESRKVYTDFEEFSYDYLVLACGATHSYFKRDEWEEFAPGLKSIEEATEIRRRIFLAFELAEREKDIQKQREYLTFIVVGGGPTGVELAGSLGEITRYTLSKDFRNINPGRTRIILIEANNRILPSFLPELSEYAARTLEKLGVTIWTNTYVTEVGDGYVKAGEEIIRAKTILWAAGIEASSLSQKLHVEKDKIGRVIVEPDLSIKNYPNVFVIGDMANFSHTKDGVPLPGIAPVAVQQGRFVAQTIIRDLEKKPRESFVYFDKGIMATIGRFHAILEVRNFRLKGFLAWLIWVFVHILYLIGFRNKLIVFIEWAWSFFTFKRGARLIRSKIWRTRELENAILTPHALVPEVTINYEKARNRKKNE